MSADLSPSAHPLVLVADDEEDILELVSLRLEQAGYEVAKARDGEAAVRLAKELGPDLAVVDVMMPRKDGYTVTEELRANPSTRHLPVIMLTARVKETDFLRGCEVGAVDYIMKPFNTLDLCSRVQAILAATPAEGVELSS